MIGMCILLEIAHTHLCFFTPPSNPEIQNHFMFPPAHHFPDNALCLRQFLQRYQGQISITEQIEIIPKQVLKSYQFLSFFLKESGFGFEHRAGDLPFPKSCRPVVFALIQTRRGSHLLFLVLKIHCVPQSSAFSGHYVERRELI